MWYDSKQQQQEYKIGKFALHTKKEKKRESIYIKKKGGSGDKYKIEEGYR